MVLQNGGCKLAEFKERKDYNKVISIKLVMPVGCNAKCPFCYNRDKSMTQYNVKEFLDNFIPSLEHLLNEIGDKNPVSLDITGGEPTLDINLLSTVLTKLKDFNIKDKVSRVTMTTNGTNISQIPENCLIDVVNYVNISVHDHRHWVRKNIMQLDLCDFNYEKRIFSLNLLGIKVSAVAVISEEIPNFPQWRDDFINWAHRLGFIAVRFRCDVFWKNSNCFDTYMMDSKNEEQFDVINYECTPDSHWCRLRRKDGMRVFFLHGVMDTTEYTKGIEYVIHTDGKCYCDFYKRTPIDKYEYEIGKIYDWVN